MFPKKVDFATLLMTYLREQAKGVCGSGIPRATGFLDGQFSLPTLGCLKPSLSLCLVIHWGNQVLRELTWESSQRWPGLLGIQRTSKLAPYSGIKPLCPWYATDLGAKTFLWFKNLGQLVPAREDRRKTGETMSRKVLWILMGANNNVS